jgi:hypothetical protein
MSKREEHPIDDHFRRVLAQAEVTPPPEVWQGVVRARAARGGGMAWWAWRWVLPALLLLGVGTYLMGTYSKLQKQGPDRTMAQFSKQGAGASWGGDHVPVVAWAVGGGADQDNNIEQLGTPVKQLSSAAGGGRFAMDQLPRESAPGSGSASRMASGPATGKAAQRDREQGTAGAAPMANSKAVEAPMPAPTIPLITDREPVVPADQVQARYLALRPFLPEPAPHTFAHSQRALPAPYVLPKGQWWLGAQAARYEVQRRWHGQDAGLVDALNATEAATTAQGFGLLVGHDRHNGWGASLGVMLERSEQGFRYVDRKVEVEQEIITYFVTLNTQVFVSDVDTVTTYLVEETTTTGPRRLSVLRIPVEGHWHRQAGRWTWGFRAGVALELTRAEGGLSLQRNAGDGRVLATELTKHELRDRHPAQFLLTVGGDLGYMLHERWRLMASPVYMFAPTSPTPAAPVLSTDARWGLQMRLAYQFNPCRK